MLCAIKQSDQSKVNAWDVLKNEGPFICPHCRDHLNLKQGQIKVHHFAHKPPVSCQFGLGESEAHRKAKISIYNYLLSQGIDCEIEKNLGCAIPDIYAVIKNIRVAIEIQISNLTLDEIIKRTGEYNKLNIYVLWLPILNIFLLGKKYSPKIWEKWLHATYFGRVYYWAENANILPIHFDDYMLYVEASDWYGEGGEECSGGDYYKRSKRYRTPMPYHEHINIIQHFKPIYKKSWMGGQLSIPDCKIYSDTLSKWW